MTKNHVKISKSEISLFLQYSLNYAEFLYFKNLQKNQMTEFTKVIIFENQMVSTFHLDNVPQKLFYSKAFKVLSHG